MLLHNSNMNVAIAHIDWCAELFSSCGVKLRKTVFYKCLKNLNDNRPYVASQLVYKCDHCGYLKPKIKSLRSSQAKIQKWDIGAWGVFREIALQASE